MHQNRYDQAVLPGPGSLQISLTLKTGSARSVVMHTYTQMKGLALSFRGGSLHSFPQGSEGVSVLEGSR